MDHMLTSFSFQKVLQIRQTFQVEVVVLENEVGKQMQQTKDRGDRRLLVQWAEKGVCQDH